MLIFKWTIGAEKKIWGKSLGFNGCTAVISAKYLFYGVLVN